MIENALRIAAGGGLVGVTCDPDSTCPQYSGAAEVEDPPTFVFLNAGLTHRVGPSRLYVRMARSLAEMGIPSLRFDWSGLGDSGARDDDTPVGASIIEETRMAMDHLSRERGAQRFVLIGLCSGATVSLLTAQEDDRVVGAVLINAQSHLHGEDAAMGEGLRAKTMTRHSWRIALRSSFRKKNWRKALTGKVAWGAVLKAMIRTPLAAALSFSKSSPRSEGSDLAHHGTPKAGIVSPVERLQALTRRGVRLVHIYSEGDEGLDYFNLVFGGRAVESCERAGAETELIVGANHVFTLLWSQDRLVECVRNWARHYCAPGSSAPAGSVH